MSAATISRIMDIIPERTVRTLTGTQFDPQTAVSPKHPDRFGYLQQFLNWMTPLTALSKDDQRTLGLLSSNGRPLNSKGQETADLSEEAGEPMLGEDLADEVADLEAIDEELDEELEEEAEGLLVPAEAEASPGRATCPF